MANPLPPLGRPAEVLLVDDDENDVSLVREAFQRSQTKAHVHTVGNGRECLAFLRKEEPFGAVATPDLILLDLDMPVMDGRETLAALAADPLWRHLPVVVLTTSASEQVIQEIYALGCRTYIVKPLEFEDFESAISLVCDYWFRLAALPGNNQQ